MHDPELSEDDDSEPHQTFERLLASLPSSVAKVAAECAQQEKQAEVERQQRLVRRTNQLDTFFGDEKPEWLLGLKYPSSPEEWFELAIQAGIDKDRLYGDDWRLDDLVEIIRGYALMLRGSSPHPERNGFADGPLPPNKFRWQGTEFSGLAPIQWRLVNSLWNATDMCAQRRNLAETVWHDHAMDITKDAVGSARRGANAFFKKHAIPFRVTIKDEYVRLVNSAPG